MAKTISQETFDSAVKENMEEFDMSPEDALTDAVQQFEAQGVDLSNIIKDLSLYGNQSADNENSTKEHPVIIATKALITAIGNEPIDVNTLITSCEQIKSECDIDLAHRCLAGRNDAYPTLLKVWTHVKEDPKPLESCLEALCALCNGQPDLLDINGRQLTLDLLKSGSSMVTSESNIGFLAIKFIRLTCIKHENNRQAYVKDDVISILVDTLSKNKGQRQIVKEVCFALRVLTFDDDIRATFGKAHEHAKMIVTEAGALKKIMSICQDYIDDQAVLGELFSTLGSLAVRDEFCREIMDLGGLQLMLQTLGKNINHQGITKQVVGVLKAIAGNDAVKDAIVKHQGLELILSAMSKHIRNPGLCEMSCAAIGAVVLRKPSHCQLFMEAGGADILVKVLQIHQTAPTVQKQVCMAIRNIVARTRDYTQPFIELGIEPLIQKVYMTQSTCRDEAKAALRDLGCQVELKELWKGEGREIHQ